MAELITGIAQQPDFPRVDLSDDNAELLELMMANMGIVDDMHAAVEQISWIFRVGHVSILHGVNKVHDVPERIAAVNHGVATFEAITAMVGGIAMVSDPTPVNRQASTLRGFDSNELSDYFDTAMDAFREDTPRTAEVIRSSTGRFVGPLCSYALLGAAMSRQFELDSVA